MFNFIVLVAVFSQSPQDIGIVDDKLIAEVQAWRDGKCVTNIQTGETVRLSKAKSFDPLTEDELLAEVGPVVYFAWKSAKAVNLPAWERVSEVSDDRRQVHITYGWQNGLQLRSENPNQIVTLFRRANEMKDDKKRVVGIEKVNLGELRIINVYKSYCKAEVIGDFSPKLEDIIQMDDSATVVVFPLLNSQGQQTSPGNLLRDEFRRVFDNRGFHLINNQEAEEVFADIKPGSNEFKIRDAAAKAGANIAIAGVYNSSEDFRLQCLHVDEGVFSEITNKGVEERSRPFKRSSPPVKKPENLVRRSAKPKSMVFSFNDPEKIRQDWLILDNSWRVENSVMKLTDNGAMRTRSILQGDFIVRISYKGMLQVSALGERFGAYERSAKIATLERRGNLLSFQASATGTPTVVQLKQTQLNEPTTVEIRKNQRYYGGDLLVETVRIDATKVLSTN